jgi:predicted ABC-type ATPase
VIAGPNGSGKSTLTEHLRAQGIDFGQYINADELARSRELNGEEGSREAQAMADELRADCLQRGIDFSFETVMSHPSKVDFMGRAVAAGYEVTLFFVATVDARLNVERVRNRVALGGHDVPEDRIVARYERSLALLPQAIIRAKRSVIFDNSASGVPAGPDRVGSALRPVAEIENLREVLLIRFFRPVPEWALVAVQSGASSSLLQTRSEPAA